MVKYSRGRPSRHVAMPAKDLGQFSKAHGLCGLCPNNIWDQVAPSPWVKGGVGLGHWLR